jgi:DNA (cytosine-5)-methyltransferase 1
VPLVLSLFSGCGALDEGFREAGWCVVSAGDVAWSSLFDIRGFHPPAGVFEGVIGGDPCQSHSVLANLVRAKGLEPSFPDLTPEFERVVEEAQPAWCLRENVPNAPPFQPWDYYVHTFLLDNAWLGEEQMRKRRFWFGTRDKPAPNLRRWIPGVALEVMDPIQTVTHRADPVPVKLGGSGKVKKSAATGRHHGAIGTTGGHAGNPPRYSLAEMLELQGLPKDLFDWSPLTMQGKRKLVGNAVSLPMARAVAQAVRKALL